MCHSGALRWAYGKPNRSTNRSSRGFGSERFFCIQLSRGCQIGTRAGIDPQVVQRVLIQGGPRRVTPLVTPKPSPGNEQRIQHTGG